MDKETRNHIQRATQAARDLLERDFGEQLDGVFDIRLDGTIAAEPGNHLDATQRLLRTKLVAAVDHCRSAGLEKTEAVDAYLREAAFTMLNRFVALKMLEARGLVQECLSHGEESAGFREFTGLAPGLVQLPDHGYRLYIESLFDEIGCEVRVLFDRRDPASLLWPGRQTLHDLLAILNAPELAVDYLAEALRELRKHNFTEIIDHHFSLGSHLNARDRKAVRRTVSGLVKILHPHGQVSREDLEELLQLALEGRRRVKEQLKKMGSFEYYQTSFSHLSANKTPFGVARELDTSDFQVEVIDLLGNKVEAELGVAFFIAAYSALRKAPPQPGLLVLGDMSIQGNIKPVRSLTEPLQVAMDNGAKRALIPIENKRQFLEVNPDVLEQVDPIFFGDLRQTAFKALGLN